MVRRTIVGVDFSGGGEDTTVGNTRVTKGNFDGNALTNQAGYPTPISRTKLRGLLCALPKGSVAALDFPFGVAREVFPDLELGKSTMKEVWDRVSEMRFNDKEGVEGFDTLRANHRKTKRKFDEKHYPKNESLSPQDERMRHMTYHGIKMLKELHKKCPGNWHIPPLHCGRTHQDRVTLLEVMPGAALNARDLPSKDYKNTDANKGRKGLTIVENRRRILNKKDLSDKFGIDLPNFEEHRDFFVFNDDALDSFVASIVAALWASEADFPIQNDNDPAIANAVRLEGCIYAPSKSVISV